MTRAMSRFTVGALFAAALAACGSEGPSDQPAGAAGAAGAAATAAEFTGHLSVSSTTTTVGTPITVSESATNLTGSQVGPIIIGIRRLGFNVVSATKPRTGICRIAGSATCNFVELAAYETQTYTLTLVATTPGTYQIQGWATSSYVPGGSSESVTVTVH